MLRANSLRISIDVIKPLRRRVFIKVGSMADERWIPITYEKLSDFCYGCGKLDHVLKDCDEHKPDEEMQTQYGPWLRATSHVRKSFKNTGFAGENQRVKGRGRGTLGYGSTENFSDVDDSKHSRIGEYGAPAGDMPTKNLATVPMEISKERQ